MKFDTSPQKRCCERFSVCFASRGRFRYSRQFTDNRLTKGVEHAIPPERGVRVGYYVPDLPGRQYLLAVASPVALDLRLHLARLKEKRGDFEGAVAAFN